MIPYPGLTAGANHWRAYSALEKTCRAYGEGLVGFFGPFEALMDGGVVTAPSRGFCTPNNKWEVENQGIAPDVEVELDPKAVRERHDPQLEKTQETAIS